MLRTQRVSFVIFPKKVKFERVFRKRGFTEYA